MVLKKLKYIVIALLLASLYSCYEPIAGSGSLKEESRNVKSDFFKLSFDGVGKVIIRQGSPTSIKVKTDDNFINDVKTEQDSSGALLIRTPKNIKPSILEINITMIDISDIKLAGKGDILFPDFYDSNGDIFLTNIGTGSIDFINFSCSNADVADSLGSISISFKDKLMATILGPGNIYYKGDPKKVTSIIKGKGRVIPIN